MTDEVNDFHLPTLNQKKGSDFEKGVENDLIKEIYKSKFFEKFEATGLDLDIVSNGKKNRNEQFHLFNLFLKDMFENQRYYMQDMVSFLVEDVLETKQVLNCLNEENRYELEYEMKFKYHIKQNESKIDLLLEDDE